MTSQNNQTELAGLTKITMSDMGLDKPLLVKLVDQFKGKETAICRVVGQATNMKPGKTDNGEYVKFIGLFQGINYLTPKVEYRSGQLILPNVAAGMLEGEVGSARAALAVDDKGQVQGGFAVVFGYEITVKGEVTAATGYVFGMRSLIKGEDPLEKMINALPPIPNIKALGKK